MTKKKGAKSSRAKRATKKSSRQRSHKKPSSDKHKKILLERRSLLIKDIRQMESNAAESSKSFEEDGTYEREILFGLIEAQEGAIREIDDALKRIREKTFGICMECEKPIDKKRLLAMPSSKLCLNCRIAYEEEIYGQL